MPSQGATSTVCHQLHGHVDDRLTDIPAHRY